MADIQQWVTQQAVCFDLIVSNPPYYQQGIECAASQREQVRYTITLDHPSLLTRTAECITEEGFSYVVLPGQTSNGFTELALNIGWHSCLRMDVTENEAQLPHRVLLTLSPWAGECFSDCLVIHGPDQNYSGAYTALAQVFYPFM